MLYPDWSVTGHSILKSLALYSYTDINECEAAEINEEDICGEKGTCKNINGSYWCKCPKGYTNYGTNSTPCSGWYRHIHRFLCVDFIS